MLLKPVHFLHFTLIKSALSQPESIFVFLPHMSLVIRIDGQYEMHPNGAQEDAVCILNWPFVEQLSHYNWKSFRIFFLVQNYFIAVF